MSYLLNYFRFLLSFLPSRLPIGVTEFDVWAGRVIAITRLPDNDSIRFTLASIIPHQDRTHFYTPKFRYACMLQKAAANQVAMSLMQDLKERQQKAAAEAAAKAAEATAQEGPSDGPQT